MTISYFRELHANLGKDLIICLWCGMAWQWSNLVSDQIWHGLSLEIEDSLNMLEAFEVEVGWILAWAETIQDGGWTLGGRLEF